jgi:hypothetical protein
VFVGVELAPLPLIGVHYAIYQYMLSNSQVDHLMHCHHDAKTVTPFTSDGRSRRRLDWFEQAIAPSFSTVHTWASGLASGPSLPSPCEILLLFFSLNASLASLRTVCTLACVTFFVTYYTFHLISALTMAPSSVASDDSGNDVRQQLPPT